MLDTEWFIWVLDCETPPKQTGSTCQETRYPKRKGIVKPNRIWAVSFRTRYIRVKYHKLWMRMDVHVNSWPTLQGEPLPHLGVGAHNSTYTSVISPQSSVYFRPFVGPSCFFYSWLMMNSPGTATQLIPPFSSKQSCERNAGLSLARRSDSLLGDVFGDSMDIFDDMSW